MWGISVCTPMVGGGGGGGQVTSTDPSVSDQGRTTITASETLSCSDRSLLLCMMYCYSIHSLDAIAYQSQDCTK